MYTTHLPCAHITSNCMMHIYSPKLCKMCLNIFFTLHTKNQEQRGAGEAAEAAQAADPVGGGAVPAGGR